MSTRRTTTWQVSAAGEARNPTASAVAAAVLGAATIGTSAILIRLSGESLATVAFLRCAGAFVLLVVPAWLERRHRGPRPRSSHAWSLLAGVLFGITLILQNYAIAALGAGIATVLSNLQVLFVASAGWALFGERPSRSYFLALPPALVGVLLVSGALDDASTAVTNGGVLLGVLTSAAYAAFMLTTKRGGRSGPPHLVGPLAEVNGAAMVVALLYGSAGADFDATPPWPAWGWLLLLLAVGPQLLGWFLITTSMTRLPIALAALILLLQPLVAVALGAVVLGERFSAGQLVGCAILVLAVLFAGSGGRAGASRS